MENTEFVVEANKMNFYREVLEGAEGKFALISTPGQLEEQFDKDQLLKLRANIRGKALTGDENMSKKKLAHECYKAATEDTPEDTDAGGDKAKKKKTRAPKEKRVTKTSIAKGILTELGQKPVGENIISRDALAEKVGHDKSNCHTMVSILRNPKRTKEPIFTSWDKEKCEYAVWPDEDTMKKEQPQINDRNIAKKEEAEAIKKAAKKAAKAEKEAQKAEKDAQKAEKDAQKAEEGAVEEPGANETNENVEG